MNLPEHIARRIRETITHGGGAGIDEEARGHDAIALMGTIGSIWMLRADGTFWDADADFGKPLGPLEEDLHTMALVYGAERFPWLMQLLPQRSPQAHDCRMCSGARRVALANSLSDGPGILCPDCHGLGWKMEALQHETPGDAHAQGGSE